MDMTRKNRRRFLILATLATQLILLIHLAVLVYLYLVIPASETDTSRFALVAASGNMRMLGINLALEAGICAGAVLGLSLFFRKTPSPEVFFFEFALLGLALSSLRILVFPLAVHVTSLFSLMPVTRMVEFGRLFAVLCFFLSGLFATGLTFQKQGSYLLAVLIISSILSLLMPMDCTVFVPPLLCSTGRALGSRIVFHVISVFAVLNYLYAASQHTSRNYSWNALAILMVISGMQIMHYFAQTPAGIAGFLLMTGGTFIFAHRTHSMYQWYW
jgi:hypothetical protein